MTKATKDLFSRHIGKTIAKHRKAVGMTQAELAERLDLSIDAISRLERGSIGLSVMRLFELAEIFECETTDLLQRSSSRIDDQAKQIMQMLQPLGEAQRIELISILERIIDWKMKRTPTGND